MLGPALIAAGGDLFGGLFGSQASQRRQEDAQNFSAEQFAKRYQTTTADMKASGLNPMLAYSQGGGNAPAGTSASGGDFGRPGSAAVNAQLQTEMNSAQVANVKADTINKGAQTDLIEAQAAQARNSAGALQMSQQKMGQEIINLKEQFNNIPLEGQRLRDLVYLFRNQVELYVQQGQTQNQVRDHLMALASKLKAETRLLDLDFDAAKSLDNIGREAGQLKPVIEILLQVLKSRR